MPPGLEAELLKLDLLKAHAADIEKEIKAVQASIMSIWKAQFSTCDTIRCYVKTAWKKAPTLAHLLATHVSHHTHINSDFFKNETHMNCTAEVKKVVEQHENQALLVDFSEDAETTEEADDDAVQAVEVETEVETTEVETTEEASEVKDKEDQQEEQGGNGRPQWHHGPPGNGRRPPWARPGGRPPWAGGRPPWARPNSRRPWAGGRPPWATEENHTPAASPPSDSAHPHSQSHFQPFALTPQDQFKIAFFIAAALIIGVGALTFGCCICIRRKCIFLRDPRRKADCAARREERRTRALYRKAACKYRVRTFFQRFRRPFASSDYEEKRELILNQESESADVVRPQINGLRNTHLLVREMMRAEEGSSSFQHQRTEGRAPAELEAAERASIRSETLPAYSLPPPSYANDLGSDFSVVDGFTGYTPSVTDGTPDDTTQSSVVDCSPRLSFDTQRTETTRSRE
ncbi:uncharacterized protein HMPREF1541_02411 [Cyphellophora europaea CBS 101466]|uniref:Uncharacterized protein n=1 Tax=Cyphellophora europaea (strain CBS 101466) TaxID=1220924 RepID=W2S3I8_CYPE1|nr:uncharacterized protein HMPREF1541_02411 [Cyphellophora europaea CBS 101466]ETN43252.1 hypothetical protein HMPREF1541_02411 [Cyphellophora europaea CBS 101466]